MLTHKNPNGQEEEESRSQELDKPVVGETFDPEYRKILPFVYVKLFCCFVFVFVFVLTGKTFFKVVK